MRVLTIIFFILCFSQLSLAQFLFRQDIFHGGVTAGGFSSGQGFGSGTFNLYLEPGSTVRKAYLFSYTVRHPPLTVITVNGTPYIFDTLNRIMDVAHFDISTTPIRLYFKDITNDLNNFPTTTFNITIPTQLGLPINEGWWTAFIYIEYENPSLQKVASTLWINDKDYIGNESYIMSGLNPINTLNPVGFSVMSDRACDNTIDGTIVNTNGNILGIIGIPDAVNNSWGCSGTKGHFYYQNNILYGLDDDTPDAVMSGSDGLADISSYLINNVTNYSSKFILNTSSGDPNLNLFFLNAYTTPCDTFSVNLLTEDTTVCKGASVQLGAFSVNPNIKYEWLPQKDLSCYSCANPVFTGDSSQVYTVRIWNTDSCSKVLPVRVKVLPLPKFTSIVTTPSACGVSTGSTTAVSSSSTDSLFSNGFYVGKAPKTLTNLYAGNYTLYLEDTNSCKSEDTTVTINSVNLTNALFTLNPTTGAVPLSVSSENQSTHATDYSWYFQNDSTTITSPSFEFDTSGTYTITLIAYNNTPDCSDTFSLQIVVYDSLQLIIPNVFTPNGDNQNDVFSIQVNAPCTGTIIITNRWGNEMLSKSFTADGKDVSTTLNGTKILIWNGLTDGQKASDGVYFYSLSLRDKKNKEYHFQGFVELVR